MRVYIIYNAPIVLYAYIDMHARGKSRTPRSRNTQQYRVLTLPIHILLVYYQLCLFSTSIFHIYRDIVILYIYTFPFF